MDETHTKDCSYNLVRLEVIVGLSEPSSGYTDEAHRWNPKTVKHTFTLKDTSGKVEERQVSELYIVA